MAMVTSYPVLDLSRNRPLTEAEVDRCRVLAADLQRVSRQSGSTEDEANWVSPAGDRVYGQITTVDFTSVDADFLSRLRLESYMFSGVRLTSILGSNAGAASWNDFFWQFYPAGAEEVPDWCILAFKEYTRDLPREYVCDPPLVMGEVGYQVGPHCVNRDVVSYQERINLLRDFGEIERLRSLRQPVILEIGGGYGGLAYFLKRLVPHATYVIVDLPRSLIFSGCYLAVALQRKCQVELYDGQSRCSSGNIWLIVNRLLDCLRDIRVDLAINTMSFGEMSRETVAGYASFIARHLASNGALFEQNFDNSHFDSNHFSSPSEVLAQHFPFRTQAPGRVYWGQASIWKSSIA